MSQNKNGGAVSGEKASIKLLTGYGLGEVACQMSWYMINNYLNIFYTDVVGLSGAAISAIVLIARIWDAINDPMMGQIADRTNTRWGRFRPYLFFAPPFLAIFNILTFTVFPIQGLPKIILCGACYIGAGMAYTACSIAYQALLNVIAVDSRVRQLLATARSTGASIIGIILSMVAMPLILHFSSAVNEAGEAMADGHGYFVTTVIFSLILIPVFWICAIICKETYKDKLHSNASMEKATFASNMKGLLQNDQLLMVVIATVIGTICVTGRYGILVYHVIYVVGGPQYIATMFTAMTIGQLVGTLTVPWGTKVFGKKNYMIIMNVVMAAGFVALFVVASVVAYSVMSLNLVEYLADGIKDTVVSAIGGFVVTMVIRTLKALRIRERYGDGNDGYVFDVTEEDVEEAKRFGKLIGASRISLCDVTKHDALIAFLSQLPHAIAVSLMTSCDDPKNLSSYTGDSFRDLTRIASINEKMWSELFLSNKKTLVDTIDSFQRELDKLKIAIADGDRGTIEEMMVLSTTRRKEF
jgi:sugar (glycoside-pentoside-hexuronide) transporter